MFKLIKSKTYLIRVYCTGRLPSGYNAKWDAQRGCYEIASASQDRSIIQSKMNALVQNYYALPRRPDEEDYQRIINCYIVEQARPIWLHTDGAGLELLKPYRDMNDDDLFGNDKWQLELMGLDEDDVEFEVIKDTGLREKLQKLANSKPSADVEWIVPTAISAPVTEIETPTSE